MGACHQRACACAPIRFSGSHLEKAFSCPKPRATIGKNPLRHGDQPYRFRAGLAALPNGQRPQTDETTLPTCGSKTDAYKVFKGMLDDENPPDDWAALHKQATDRKAVARLEKASPSIS